MKKIKCLSIVVLALGLLMLNSSNVFGQQSPREKKIDATAKKAQIQQNLKATKAKLVLANKAPKDKARNTKLTPAQIQAKQQRLAEIKANPAAAKKNSKKANLQLQRKDKNKNARKVEQLRFNKVKFEENTTNKKVKLRRQQ